MDSDSVSIWKVTPGTNQINMDTANKYIDRDIQIGAVNVSLPPAEVILTGYSASITSNDAILSNISGTMANNGAINAALNCGDEYTIPSGYTSGGTISVNSLADQTSATAVASNIEYGYTAWVNGEKITGTKIVTTPLAIPVVLNTYTYNSAEQTPSFANYDSEKMIIGGTTSATEAGTYLVSFTPVGGYEWEDETTDAKYVEWTINKLSLTKPNISNTSYTYNTSLQSPTINNYNASYENQSGTSSATTVGSYTITWSLKNTTSLVWSDGTTADVSNTWSIEKLLLTIPSLTNTSYTYDSGTKAPTINNYNSTYENQSGTISAINASTYTIIWSLKDTSNTQWSDGTISDKNNSWIINRAAGYITLSSTSGSVNKNNSITFAVNSYSGSLSVSSSNTGVATTSISGATVYVNGVASGNYATIYVYVAESTNYTSASASYSVYVNYVWIRYQIGYSWGQYGCNASASGYADSITNYSASGAKDDYVSMGWGYLNISASTNIVFGQYVGCHGATSYTFNTSNGTYSPSGTYYANGNEGGYYVTALGTWTKSGGYVSSYGRNYLLIGNGTSATERAVMAEFKSLDSYTNGNYECGVSLMAGYNGGNGSNSDVVVRLTDGYTGYRTGTATVATHQPYIVSYSYSQGSYIQTVYSTSSSAYPSNGKSGDYWYVYSSAYNTGSVVDTVASSNSSSYADNGITGSYWCVKQ